jgi:hypothetical protein
VVLVVEFVVAVVAAVVAIADVAAVVVGPDFGLAERCFEHCPLCMMKQTLKHYVLTKTIVLKNNNLL